MNIHSQLASRLLSSSSPVQTQNLTVQQAQPSSVIEPQKELAEPDWCAVRREETKKMLGMALKENSPQELNKLYESALDNRVKVYSEASGSKEIVSEAYVDKATRRVNYGKAQGESAEELNSLIERISQGAEQAHSETRNILAGLGRLDPSTENYIAESQTYTRFALDELNSKIGVDEKFATASDNKKDFSLQVTTREGDEIKVNIKQSNEWSDLTFSDQISVKYEVEGELSESEQQALGELMNAIGSASDSLLAGNDLTSIMGIKEFNGTQLADFSLSLKGSGQDVEYKYALDGDQQNLKGKWSQDGQVKTTFNLTSKLGGAANEHELAQYLDLLDEAADASHYLNEKERDRSSGLFKNTLTDFMNLAVTLGESLAKADKEFDQTRTLADTLFTKMNHEQTARLGLQDEDKARFKEGFNRLVDFSADFVANGGGKKSKGKFDPSTGYQMQLRQKTSKGIEATPNGVKEAVKQSRKVMLDGVMDDGRNERDHQLTEKYEIKAVIDDFSMQAVKQKRDTNEHLREKIYHGMGEYTFSEMDRKARSENSLYFLKEGSLELSQLAGGEKSKKGIMAGDKITWQHESSKPYDYNAKLLISKDKDFREAERAAISIESQKRLLDKVLDAL